MDELPFIIYALAYLAFILAIIVLIGHGTWLFLAWLIRSALGRSKPTVNHDDYNNYQAPKPTDELSTKLLDLSTTAVQLEQFKLSGSLDENTHSRLMQIIDEERVRLKVPPKRQSSPGITHIPQPVSSTEVNEPAPERFEEPRASWLESEPGPAQPAPTFFAEQSTSDNIHISEAEPAVVVERKPRRSFSEVLNSFMEESNIRWGEIIGGLLIIGCSTALVISLWAQISEIPVLKFLIFTTVTAVLFGVGLYTEHRWKLPTTSRGILTIATLLVPLNFLAIAAVSSSSSSGMLVIASELMAPAIFLCLVYFAGRVITPGCAHLLSAGVLGSSIGQLLVRHFASPEMAPALLVLLGAFPVVCYLVTSGLAVRLLLADNEIDEHETNTVFTMLGAMSFSALLPFGLLLYKSGPLSMTMMYLAPIVTAWGLPLLATGTILYCRIYDKKLVGSRVAGTALAIIGVVIVLSGVILAWPNPASIVPAALLSVAVFTALAIVLEIPFAHLIAAYCLALAYLVGFHVLAGHISWVNLRVASLLDVCVSSSSGNALVLMSLVFLFVSEQFRKWKRTGDESIYFIAASSLGLISLMVASLLDVNHGLWLVFFIYSLSAIWVAVRRQAVLFSWIAAALLFLALGVGFGRTLNLEFPWQTTFLVHATICAVAAILSLRSDRTRVVLGPLNIATLLSSGAAILSLFQTNPWQVTSMQAERVFWIAGVMLMSLWLNRRRSLFVAFQIMVTAGTVLSVKALLQQYDWYTYLPHAFLHPWGLQIQGTVLALLGLVWISLRIVVRHIREKQTRERVWIDDAWRLLDMQVAIDRVISWGLLVALFVLAAYGSLSGVTQELAARGSEYQGVNIAGFPHQEALGLGSWVVLGLVTVLMLGHVWERRRYIYILGAVAASTAIVPLLAGLFENQIAVATAWRWLAAVFLCLGAVVIWFRNRIAHWLKAAGWPQLEHLAGVSNQARTVLIGSTLIPIAVLTYYPAVRAIYYLPVRGPISGLFSWFGDTLSYAVPLVVVGLIMIGFAVRERSPRFAFYGSLLFNSTITLIYLLSIVAVNGPMDRLVVVTLFQLNAISFSAFALFWLSFRNQWDGRLEQEQARVADVLLQTQMWMAIGLNLLLIVPLTVRLVITPAKAGVATFATGSILGWFAFLITTTLSIWLLSARRHRISPVVYSAVLMAMSCLIALNLAESGGWNGLHALKILTAIVSWLLVLSANLPARIRESLDKYVIFDSGWRSKSWLLATLVGSLSVWLSLETLLDSKANAWWSIVPLLSISALAATLNWQTRRRRHLFAAAILFNLSVSIWGIALRGDYLLDFTSFILTNITLGSLAGILWLVLELRARRGITETLKAPWLSVHTLVAILGFFVLSTIVLATFNNPNLESRSIGFTWSAFTALTLLMVACIWDRSAKFAVAGLYLLGLVAAAILLGHAQLPPTRLNWAITILLSIYTLATALAWHLRGYLIAFFSRFNAPERIESGTTQLVWLTAFNLVAVAILVGLAYWIDLRFSSFVLRSTAALAVISQSVTLGLMAEGNLRTRWQRLAVALFGVGAILLLWSGLTPGINATWLNRSVIVMLAVFGLTGLFGAVQSRLRVYEGWNDAVRACLPWALGSAVLSLIFCLATEVFYQVNFGAVRINWLSLVAIGLTLVGCCVACILFALSPEHDPLGLPEKKKTHYVYVAEAMLALLFLHIRLTMPWLFTGFLERYWPLVVMFVAYAGVVVSEMLRNKKLLVLAEPLKRTGALLPLLPVLGFWIASSEVDFSMVLFLVGGLYGLLSILRRSLLFGALAAVCGNGALWYMLHRTADYQFLQHPQLWLIPVALSVLIAAYLNEDRLTQDQMSSVRFLSLVTVYVSSTADIFISGVENSPWLPLLLGVFSLAGIFSGIIFRIRGLLLLGAIFLLLSIVTMIWFASANLGWTWLWYVAGIATGATIIFMFAVFEKKRSEVLRVVEGFKEWDR